MELQEGSKSLGQSDNDPIDIENQLIGNPKSAIQKLDKDIPRIFEISKEKRNIDKKNSD